MNRETKSIKTPEAGIELVLNTYVTGLEKRHITNVFLNEKLSDSDKYNQGQDLALGFVVVSIDGKKAGEINVVEAILNMRMNDTKFVMDSVNEVTSGKNADEKKTS